MSPQREKIIAVAATVVIVLVFCAPMFRHFDGFQSADAYRMADWRHDLSFYFHAKLALFQFGEFPLRSHLVGGGYPILGHPSDGSLSPFSIPFLLLPPWLAIRFNLMLLLWLGTFGTYLLARRVLGLDLVPALLSATAFAFAGWFPSFMLVGFYVQAFYLMTPLALYALLRKEATWRGGVGAGLLLLPILLQSGLGILAVGHFLLLATVLVAAHRSERPRALFIALGAFLILSAAVSYHGVITWWGSFAVAAVIALVAWRWEPLRALAAAWRPYALRLAVAALTLALVGCAKWAAVLDVMGRGTYVHEQLGKAGDVYRFDGPTNDDKVFYKSAGAFLRHAHATVTRHPTYTTEGWPAQAEYASMGLTYGVLALFLLAAALARRRLAPWIVLWLFYAVCCFGPNLPGDPFRTFLWGLPGFFRVNHSYKYLNFFLVLSATVSFGAAAAWLTEKTKARWAWIPVALLLLWPLWQNAPLWADLLREPVDVTFEPGAYYQVHQLPEGMNPDDDPGEIKRRGLADGMRERARPTTATEFFNVPRGIGLIDWYADITLPEQTVPRYWVLSSGELAANPNYAGECAWQDVSGEMLDLRFTFNTVDVHYQSAKAQFLQLNQNYDPAWRVSRGSVTEIDGRLGIAVPAGEHRVRLTYWPTRTLTALFFSLMSLVAALVILLRPRRRDTSD
ncbi:MAG: hypothetical protein P9L99_10860 [Candidatus Lernaella stagnicola]|nr:hypothetical protein [Candidatus Lernaella stagnicola]